MYLDPYPLSLKVPKYLKNPTPIEDDRGKYLDLRRNPPTVRSWKARGAVPRRRRRRSTTVDVPYEPDEKNLLKIFIFRQQKSDFLIQA